VTASSNTKIIRCYNCQGLMRVAERALSVFCPHCQKRVTVESLRITGSHPGRVLATCGDVHVEASAKLNVSLLARNIYVMGRVNGPITATGVVEVGSSGRVIGDIEAAKIVVRDGGVIQGKCIMRSPTQKAKHPPKQPNAATPKPTGIPSEPSPSPASESPPAESWSRPKPLLTPGAAAQQQR
jgi:cytoskeletal protein CcmA (bactofilin family)